jgi:hypothetical protein
LSTRKMKREETLGLGPRKKRKEAKKKGWARKEK